MATVGIRLNLSNSGLSQICGMAIESVTKIGDTYAAASPDGIGTIGGDTDNDTDIDAYISVPNHDYAIKNVKRIRRGYVVYESTGDLSIVCTPNQGTAYTAGLTTTETSGQNAKSFEGKRSCKGTHWKFEITNVDGVWFALDYFGLLFNPLTRRRSL